MIHDNIHDKQKEYLVKGGDAQIFGEDADVRRRMNPDAVAERFLKVWRELLEPEIRVAPTITLEEAREMLEGGQRNFAQEGYQYRQFSLRQVPFIVRLNNEATEDGVCDQIWTLGKLRDPTRLSIYFHTIVDKERFDNIARNLKYVPRDLALELVMDFMNKFHKD